MKQAKTISLEFEPYLQGDWPPNDLKGFLAWFESKLADIPEQFRDAASIGIGSTTNYDSSYATIEIRYVRPETDEEEAERERQAAALEEFIRAADLQTLAELQAKYGQG